MSDERDMPNGRMPPVQGPDGDSIGGCAFYCLAGVALLVCACSCSDVFGALTRLVEAVR